MYIYREREREGEREKNSFLSSMSFLPVARAAGGLERDFRTGPSFG